LSSKASVSGKRKLVPIEWQRETSHCSINKAVFGKQGISELNNPQYSPDLFPSDVFLFPKIKSTLKRGRFEDTEVTKEM
jgi:hypothetical protein